MQFFAPRCPDCQSLSRMSDDEAIHCQCARTTRVVPPSLTPPKPNPQDELVSLFSRNLSLSNPQQQQQQQAIPTPPISPIFASMHYHHSSHVPLQSPPSPVLEDEMVTDDDDPVSAQLRREAESVKDRDREYAEYLMATDLSSPNSLNELEIALAHGIISEAEYRASIQSRQDKARLAEEGQRHRAMMQVNPPKALGEDCTAMDLLSAARKRERLSEWTNDYYGGVDKGWFQDEESPCSVYSGAVGRMLRPFDL